MVRATSVQGACQKEQMTNFDSEHLAFQATAKLDTPEFQRNFRAPLFKAAIHSSPMRVACNICENPFLGKDNPAIGTPFRIIQTLSSYRQAQGRQAPMPGFAVFQKQTAAMRFRNLSAQHQAKVTRVKQAPMQVPEPEKLEIDIFRGTQKETIQLKQ